MRAKQETRWFSQGLLALALLCAGCEQAESPRVPLPAGAAHFDPDRDPDNLPSDALSQRFGPVPVPSKKLRFGAVMKFLGNHYWQLLADGMSAKARSLGATLDVRSAASELDEAGQLQNMQAMVEQGYDVIFVSPQTNTNLQAAVRAARAAGIWVINVDDAVLDDASHYVGPNQYENGVRAANYLAQQFPAGGDVALIRGVENVYASQQRSQGFLDALKGKPFRVVADEHGDWDLQRALVLSTTIVGKHPGLIGIYCNNDIMALGAVEAVKRSARGKPALVLGTDGIAGAFDSIRAGGLAGTVDTLPYQTGEIAVEVAVRLLAGQALPRVVYSPQELVSRESLGQN
jgi:ribose transport system substrate-binding protein